MFTWLLQGGTELTDIFQNIKIKTIRIQNIALLYIGQ